MAMKKGAGGLQDIIQQASQLKVRLRLHGLQLLLLACILQLHCSWGSHGACVTW